jgi:hypothetical protein
MLIDPADPRAPKFWMYETSGVLRPVIETYLHGEQLTRTQIATMRAYLRQWIFSPVWGGGPGLEKLRGHIDTIQSRADIDRWLTDATDEGIDPL